MQKRGGGKGVGMRNRVEGRREEERGEKEKGKREIQTFKYYIALHSRRRLLFTTVSAFRKCTDVSLPTHHPPPRKYGYPLALSLIPSPPCRIDRATGIIV